MYFDGRIRDLGEVPPELLEPVSQKLRLSDSSWVADQTSFLTRFPSTEHMVFRFPDDYPNRHTPASYRTEWSEWEGLLSPLIQWAARSYKYPAIDTAKVMFTKLKPGGVIPEHVDSNPSSVIPHKIHIPLKTNSKVALRIDGVSHHLAVGRAYEINNLLPHQAENRSGEDRVHFIFECFPAERGAP